MEGDLFVAVATMASALVTLFGSVYVFRKTKEQAQAVQKSNDEQQRQLSLLSAQLGVAVHKSNTAYSKKLEVLAEAAGMLGEIRFLVESYLVPYTSHSKRGSVASLAEACRKFEELRRFHLMRSIFFDANDQLGKQMHVIMEELNKISNLQVSVEPAGSSNWQHQVASFQQVISPAVESVKSQFRDTLEMEQG